MRKIHRDATLTENEWKYHVELFWRDGASKHAIKLAFL